MPNPLPKSFVVQHGDQTINPAGSPTLHGPKTTVFGPPGPPSPDVATRQDPSHTQADFLSDLDAATQRRDDGQ